MKHTVLCNDDGLVTQHAILQRNGEEEFRFFAAGLPWANYLASQSKFDMTIRPYRSYLFQVAGPTSLETLERTTGESLGDIRFLRFRPAVIAGLPVEIGRIGMSGNLAYEVRGLMDEGATVFQAILEAGKGLGIHRLGWRTYFVNHIEGGFPQTGWSFYSAAIEDAGSRAMTGPRVMPRVTGSVDPANMRARYRTPVEIGWAPTVRLNHNFRGRAAIEAEMADPRRTMVTLRWEPGGRARHPWLAAASRRELQDHRDADDAVLAARLLRSRRPCAA